MSSPSQANGNLKQVFAVSQWNYFPTGKLSFAMRIRGLPSVLYSFNLNLSLLTKTLN